MYFHRYSTSTSIFHMSGIIIASLFKLSKREWYFSGFEERATLPIWKIWIITWGSRKSTSCISRIRIEYEAFKAGCSSRRNCGENGSRGEWEREARGEQKRHGKKDRRHARRGSGRGGAEEGENGFTRQSLSGRPRENHNARLPSSRRPSSSFCPPVRSSVCLPVHPFVSSSASCHSPRQPSDGSLPHQKFISSPVLLQVLLLFPPCRRSRRLVIMYCFIARTLLKFDPVTCPDEPRGVIAIERSAPPRDIR